MILTLLKKKSLDGDVYQFTFKPSKPLMWKAGQQMQITLPHEHVDNLGITRTLSIASAPFEENIILLTHCGIQSSSFKRALRDLEPGDTVEAGSPEGGFILENPHKKYTFIASGIGIAPYRAILMDLDYHNQPIDVVLIYSNSTDHFPFKNEIEELVERHHKLSVFYSVDPDEKERGRIKEMITGMEDNPIYMSGVYVRKIAAMFDGRDTHPKRVVHDGEVVESEEITRPGFVVAEEVELMSLWGE